MTVGKVKLIKGLFGVVLFFLTACAQAAPVFTPTPVPLPCQAGETQQAGPWQVEGRSYWAQLAWETGKESACLMLVADSVQQPILIVYQVIDAGHSERYSEYYAPALQPDPVLLPNQPPLIVTSRTTQGNGGGGGDLYEVWKSHEGQLINVLGFSLESYTDINTLTETPCPGGIYFYRQVDETLEVTSCFDGVIQPVQRFEFDGERFSLIAP